MKSETIIGAVIAAAILFVSSTVTLFTNDPALTFADLSTATWVSLIGGALVAFGKDFQALSFRRWSASVTGSGNVHAPAWTAILAILVASSMLAGCAGTRAAYKAADGIVETSKVVGEHYYALAREANDMKNAGVLSGTALLHAQDLVRKTRPVILELGNAAAAYEAVGSAENAQDLERALSAAAIAVSQLLDVISGKRSSELIRDIDRDLLWILATSSTALAA